MNLEDHPTVRRMSAEGKDEPDALSEQDKAEGYILAYQAKIHGDLCVDA